LSMALPPPPLPQLYHCPLILLYLTRYVAMYCVFILFL
jgi:hypothetical protein